MSHHDSDEQGRAITAAQAKQALLEGNQRFKSGGVKVKDISDSRRKDLLTNGQKPFAVILSCSDSRVPPEVIFDQALGDIFVVRDAGNIVDALTLGSIEYGVEHLGAPLLMVLGHSNCGAVKATVDGGEAPGSISAIVDTIKPTVDKLRAAGVSGNALYSQAEDKNIEVTIETIKKSPVIKHMVEHGKVEIVRAKYYLDYGEVVIF